ncbi:DUF6414 family protein [Leptospira sp. 2 VSF19]|uniref:DUF6414 family protein n=1 Tax=Leptospira soteropolitanensis TaxID=2950025 RepID=A0AAW5VCD1_9LEPT|nr:DUF6414 family protein [Leptospira soteropolitanensis]MCW7492526.1 DUF6414 family protein [Leptospira soteropolitanensis]MCW7500574.1 DUF6414 family protein [Leptospira soteropolitanensis]MCW7522756.1 DUF6414 family protein [Leptospira soteropolitanensis]MCW7526612.1 DUF6414 family protein [Leptospira soteropolitanensis]MCW7530544.1 DUF6414 family protein [Leptospira soteropolitanensis]
MKKIVYFDEQSASDYIDISLGGKKILTTSELVEKHKSLDANVGSALKAKFNWIPFLSSESNASAQTKFNYLSDKIINSTISNTILTDFINKTQDDEKIIKFENCTLSAYPNSLTFFKLFTPYVIISKDNDEKIDVTKLDDALEKGKGYYELIAKSKNIQNILRFNIKAFRNNYNLSDLLKMNLNYNAIFVGTYKISNLDMNKEFNINNKEFSLSDLEEETQEGEELNVYDVILAGVL